MVQSFISILLTSQFFIFQLVIILLAKSELPIVKSFIFAHVTAADFISIVLIELFSISILFISQSFIFSLVILSSDKSELEIVSFFIFVLVIELSAKSIVCIVQFFIFVPIIKLLAKSSVLIVRFSILLLSTVQSLILSHNKTHFEPIFSNNSHIEPLSAA
jgi:hypothetical protein